MRFESGHVSDRQSDFTELGFHGEFSAKFFQQSSCFDRTSGQSVLCLLSEPLLKEPFLRECRFGGPSGMLGLVDGGAGICGSPQHPATIASFVADGTVDAGV